MKHTILKEICGQFNFIKQAKKYHLSIWQCPGFLSFLTGIITLVVMISTYVVAIKHMDPEIVALIVLAMTAILMIFNYLIVQGFERLIEVSRLKTEFVSIVSHQLRTPLTGIKWTINLIKQEKSFSATKEQTERLEMIEENNQRMINLVNDLLNISRVEQGRLNIKPEALYLDKIIQSLIEEYKEFAKANNIKLIFTPGKKIKPVFIDRQGIELVLRNLIDNAIRYTKGKGDVKINLLEKNNSIRCEIKDNGVGIPKDDQKRIFQKFFRSQNVLKYQTQGTGLGLFIAKSVITIAEGNIGFNSKANNGTTFWFELPICKHKSKIKNRREENNN